MANKYLRRMLLFFFSSIRTHEASATSAAIKLNSMQDLSNWNLQGAPAKSVRSSCLPLQGSHCLPSSSATTIYSSSADECECISANEEGVDEEEEKHELARSHSCSNLQGKQLIPSFKSLLQRASSHNHLHDRHNQSCKLHDFTRESSSVSRSWSSPSLQMRRHIMKLPQKARSFSGSLQSKDGSRGKCAPKGHVVIYVEPGRERHVVPIAYLSQPPFQALLKRAESEFGFGQQGPGLRLPCSLSELHHTLHHIRAQY